MLLEQGGWLARAAFPHHITIAARMTKHPPCWWCTILACRREFGGPWIDALFTGTIDPQAHPFFAEIAHLRVSAHCLIRRDGEIVQYVPFDKRARMRESLSIRGVNAAMIFLLGLSWKAPIRWRIPMRSINSLRRLRGH